MPNNNHAIKWRGIRYNVTAASNANAHEAVRRIHRSSHGQRFTRGAVKVEEEVVRVEPAAVSP